MTSPNLAEALAGHRLLLGERDSWEGARLAQVGGAVMVSRQGASGEVIAVHGTSVDALDLIDAEARLYYRSQTRGAMWLSAPRSAPVPAWALDAFQLAPVSQWDWMTTTTRPAHDVSAVVVLDRLAQAEAIREVLRRANPRSSADPQGRREVAWYGIRDGEELVGVIGAHTQQGDPDGADLTWHLHGLAVLPEAAGAGLGSALTAAAVTAGLDAGADWVSLGMYADNDAARRLYERLGFRLEAEMASYAPPSISRR